MKSARDKGRATMPPKLKAYREARYRAKLDLIEKARAVEDGDHMPEYLWPDLTMDAWFERKQKISDLLEKQAGFSSHVAMLALTDEDWETKETVAFWLRTELKKLRQAESSVGSAPVRRQLAMPRTEISDVAIELLECIAGPSLICLFQELLDVDRHRKSLAEDVTQLEKAAHVEATTKLQGKPLGVREFAKLLSVAPSTVTRWRKSAEFHRRVNSNKYVWELFLRDEYFDEIKKKAPYATETECFQLAFQMYAESLKDRRQGEFSQGVGTERQAGVSPVLPKKPVVSRGKKSRKDSQ